MAIPKYNPYPEGYFKNSYFRRFSNLSYPDLSASRNSILEYTTVKNLFKSARVREDIFGSFLNFEKYQVEGNERPDQIAEKFYGDSNLDWIILLANKITNIRNQWPLSNADLEEYLKNKYPNEELYQVHHYETLEIKDFRNRLIQKKGLWVEPNHSISYIDNNQIVTKSEIKEVLFFDYERELNDEKRSIDILDSRFVPVIIQDLENIMTYQPSSQYIDDKLKKTENPRITLP
jgi:hypothetical protein